LPFDEKAAERVRGALGKRRGITEKKMMGALCFMTNGTMCCGVTGAALMVRVGAEGFARARAKPHVRPLKIGRRAARGFVLIDPRGYRTAAALATWIAQGLAVARALRGQKAAKASPARKRAR
jgi:TfoX/Sxy family transcriptional regulator of competence genes